MSQPTGKMNKTKISVLVEIPVEIWHFEEECPIDTTQLAEQARKELVGWYDGRYSFSTEMIHRGLGDELKCAFSLLLANKHYERLREQPNSEKTTMSDAYEEARKSGAFICISEEDVKVSLQ